MTKKRFLIFFIACFTCLFVYKQLTLVIFVHSECSSNEEGEVYSQKEEELITNLTERLLSRLTLPDWATGSAFKKPCNPTILQTEQACTDYNCSKKITFNLEKRIKDLVLSPHLRLYPEQRQLVQSIGKNIPESDVIILTAASSNHYEESQAMFENLHTVVYPALTNFTTVLFDIGLTKEQREETEKSCKCLVITFNPDIFPPHVKDNFCYAWKPLIILATIMKARKFLVYQDATVKWQKDFNIAYNRVQSYGHQMFFYTVIRSPLNTLLQMYNYMKEDPCSLMSVPELWGTAMIHKNDPLVIQAVLEPWVRCALERSCMCPVEPKTVIQCKRNVTTHHRCHRFDQSAITLIMVKLYGQSVLKFLAPNSPENHPVMRKLYERKKGYFQNMRQTT